MAGAGYRNFQTGEVLTATNVNTYLNEQTVMVFADAAARTTALSGVLAEGMVTYLKDTNQIEVYNGSSWVAMVRTDVANTFTTGTQTVETGGGGTVGLVIKGVLTQSANLQEWQNSTGTVITRIDNAGGLYVGTGGTFIGSTSGRALFVANGTTFVPIIAKGAASQTANLQEWQSSAGSVIARVNSSGDVFGRLLYAFTTANLSASVNVGTASTGSKGIVVAGQSGQTANLQEWQDSAATTIARVSPSGIISSNVGITNMANIGTYLDTGSNTMVFIQRSASTVGVVVRGAASQTADLQQWQNSAGTVLAKVNNAGTIIGSGVTTLNAYATMNEEQTGGRLLFKKATAAMGNPGSDNCKIYLRDGTNAGTLKLVVRAGASGAETTILDNIPQ
jgi:hypothetical protein